LGYCVSSTTAKPSPRKACRTKYATKKPCCADPATYGGCACRRQSLLRTVPSSANTASTSSSTRCCCHAMDPRSGSEGRRWPEHFSPGSPNLGKQGDGRRARCAPVLGGSSATGWNGGQVHHDWGIARYGRLLGACDVLLDRREDVPVGRVSRDGIPNVRISACFNAVTILLAPNCTSGIF
jgi:hypothetical protein